MEFSRYHISETEAIFLPMPDTIHELRLQTKTALLEGVIPEPFVITGEEIYFMESHLMTTLYLEEELNREIATLRANTIGRSGTAINCVALWAEDEGTGVLVHQEEETLLCAYLPILTKKKAQYEMDMAKRLKRLATMKGLPELERGFYTRKGNWRIEDLLSALAEHLEH